MAETKKQCLEKAARGEGCLGRAQDDEPVFVLRAQDKTAPDTVRDWATRAANAGAPTAKVTQAMHDADLMEAWQRKYGIAKVPD